MFKPITAVCAMVLLCFCLTACADAKTNRIIIASKTFTENTLLSEMYAQLIEAHTDLTVERKQGLGSTSVCIASLEGGEIDMYVEYTGTLYSQFLAHEEQIEQDRLYDLIKQEMHEQKAVTLYQPIGLNNTYALAMLGEKARSLGIVSISDLVNDAPKLVFSANDLFFARANDGYDAMVTRYDLAFRSAVRMNSELLFEAVKSDQVDVIVVYATDPLLTEYNMSLLTDDKGLFPDYYAVPIVRNTVLKKYPALDGVLDLLAGCIDNRRMQSLNYQVDIEGQELSVVARSFLNEIGLLR